MINLPEAMKKNAVVLQKPSSTIAVRVDLNTIQRKFYNALLYMAKQELRQNQGKKTFVFPLAWIKEVLNKQEKEKVDRNNSYYIERLKELKKKDVEFNILGKDFREWGSTSLVSSLRIREQGGVVYVKFELPEDILKSLIDPNGIYANLNLVVIRGLKSKYAIILYELVKDYEKVEIPEMTIEKFRKLFGVEDKYRNRTDDLKKRVLKPAIEELNNNPHIDFLVEYKLRKTGPKYTHIKFIVKPKPESIKNEQKADQLASEFAEATPELKEILALIPRDLRKKRRIINIVLGSLEKKGKDYTKAQVEYVMERYKTGKVKSVEAYLKQAIENDYAGAETVELGELDILTYDDLKGTIFRKGEKRYELVSIGEPEKDPDPPIGDGKVYYVVRFENLEDRNDYLLQKWSEEKLDSYLEKLKKMKKKDD